MPRTSRAGRATTGALLLLTALAPACEARLSLGAGCVRTGECAPPLACIGGRCRQECLSHADCALGARCQFGTGTIGRCALDSDRCGAAEPCSPGLVCRGAQCFDECGSGCRGGGSCSDGVCLRSDDGAPDAAGVDGGVLPGFALCASALDCDVGEVCAQHEIGSTSVCRPRCANGADCVVTGTSTDCIALLDIDGASVTACSRPCDPLTAGTCPGSDACDLLWLARAGGGEAFVPECRRVLAPGGLGATCGDTTLCDERLTCAAHETTGAFTCQPLCAVDGSRGPPCAATTCVAAAPPVRASGTIVGNCMPP